MRWKFQISASEQRRLLSRILQILDSQMVQIHSFAGAVAHNSVYITFAVSSEQDKANRIAALLHRLDGCR